MDLSNIKVEDLFSIEHSETKEMEWKKDSYLSHDFVLSSKRDYYLSHDGVKGMSWKEHKYLYIDENGNYHYSDDDSKGGVDVGTFYSSTSSKSERTRNEKALNHAKEFLAEYGNVYVDDIEHYSDYKRNASAIDKLKGKTNDDVNAEQLAKIKKHYGK